MKHTLPCLIAFLLILAIPPAWASPRVDLAVVDRASGQWIASMRHRGQQWIEGEPGRSYAIRLTNTTGRRVLVVLSVDGVNAITGETAASAQTGYVLEPWQSTQVEGWRKSMRQVARFVFTDLAHSYAARTGRPDNVGVIGVAVFEEARPSMWEPPVAYESRDDAARASSAAPAREESRAQSIGTGHGPREWSPAQRTEFVRASTTPAETTELRYDAYDALVARGVIPRPYRVASDRPRAFPAEFVPDPPGGDW
ncbi:hypothetical protein QLQ15_07045 [Lysobacter sp. LF1]|uniref:Uncharacterized protein n=1 Tax=Lysobacter stagni TaxID=3045172 RepID=A0ABT6XF43_9GAMM|nr:hypothetical protein [Lysobacter sp. LF1]MDI9238669.1 hypothetical protein [Lysobacter sp. LF1]